MPLTNLQRVRSLIGDMPKATVQELLVRGPVTGNLLQTDAYPLVTGTISVFVSGASRTATSTTTQLAQGIIDFVATTAITGGAQVTANYQWFHLSDDEIQSVIDAVSGVLGDRFILAAALAARGLAGNQARHFSYRIGEKQVDKKDQAQKWLNLADSLDEVYLTTIKYGNMNLTMATNDASGTPFQDYDTGIALDVTTGGFYNA